MSKRKRSAEATISTVEVAYDLGLTEERWLPRVLEASLPFLDRGLGAGGLIAVKPPKPGPAVVKRAHIAAGPPDFLMRHREAAASVPQRIMHEQIRSGPWVLSEITAQHPEMLETWRSHFDDARDAVGVLALDTDGYGIHILAPTADVVRLGRAERSRWRLLAAHLSSALRLRRTLSTEAPARGRKTVDLPHGADAVISPNDFRITDAIDDAPEGRSLRFLRAAAIQLDRSRSKKERSDNPDEALKAWWALIRGRHSMVDWFDTDGRRYILAIPNPPKVVDIRGLTERETQVVHYAALGDSHKTIAYRLGINRSTVTKALHVAMRKLGVSTQAELVAKMSAMPHK